MFEKSFTKKAVSMLMVIVMLVIGVTMPARSIQVVAESLSQTISIDGYTFTVLRNDLDVVSVEHRNGNNLYVFELDMESAEISVAFVYSNSWARTLSVETFEVLLDPEGEYYFGAETLDIVLLHSDTGISFEYMDSDEMSARSIAIPIGWLIIKAALQALLAISAAVIVAGVVWVLVDRWAEVANTREFNYFAGLLRDGKVFLGAGLSHSAARSLVSLNDPARGVIAVNETRARGLAGSNPIGPEGEFNPPWRLQHYHTGGWIRGRSHIWFWG